MKKGIGHSRWVKPADAGVGASSSPLAFWARAHLFQEVFRRAIGKGGLLQGGGRLLHGGPMLSLSGCPTGDWQILYALPGKQ